MKSFRMMSLPLIVGTLLLFCGIPKVGATTCDVALTWDHPHAEHEQMADLHALDLRSLLADAIKSAPIFDDLSDALQFNRSKFIVANSKSNRIWIMAFLDLPAGSMSGSISGGSPSGSLNVVSSSSAPITSPKTLQLVALDPPDPAVSAADVPESPSIFYLGSGLLLCGGFWLRQRRI
jgi:hypothetical protein